MKKYRCPTKVICIFAMLILLSVVVVGCSSGVTTDTENNVDDPANGVTEENGTENDTEQEQLTDEEIRARALIKNFASLSAEDIKYVPGFMGTDYSDVAALLKDLGEYRIEPFESEASLWSMTIWLSGTDHNFSNKKDAWMTLYAYGEESRLMLLYHSKADVYTHIYFDYPALHQYLRKYFKTDDVIDTDALEQYRDVIEARSEYTIEVRNSNFNAKFSGYEIVAFHQIATFERSGMTYTIYEWDVGFITDKNNANYPWVMNRVWVDSELRVRSYDDCPYFVVRTDGEKEEYAFFPWDTPLYGTDAELEIAFDEIAAAFVPEGTVGGQDVSPELTLPVLELTDRENNAACNAIMIDLKTGWWKGGNLTDCSYEATAFECVYREIIDYVERFYGYAAYFRYDESGNCVEYFMSPAIVTLDAQTQQMYNVWWPGDGAYYEQDIIARFPEEIAEFVAEPNEERYRVILERLMESASARMIPETPQDTLDRLSLLEAEDVKYVVFASKEPGAGEIVRTLGAALVNRVAYSDFEVGGMFFTLEFYLSGDDGGFSGQKDEWVGLYAGLDENVVWVWHHESYAPVVKFFVKDEALYQLVRGSYVADGVIEEEAFARYAEVIRARAQETVDQSRENADAFSLLPYTGYEILRFEMIDSFERDGAQYVVYAWDVAFLHDDPTKVGWAGGMWLDSELRVRSLELDTCFVVCLSPDAVQHHFFTYELYLNAEYEEHLARARTVIADYFTNT